MHPRDTLVVFHDGETHKFTALLREYSQRRRALVEQPIRLQLAEPQIAATKCEIVTLHATVEPYRPEPRQRREQLDGDRFVHIQMARNIRKACTARNIRQQLD